MTNNKEIEMGCKLSMALLMPEAKVKRICGEIELEERRKSGLGMYYRIRANEKKQMIDELQRRFNVSRDIVVARLTSLKILTEFQ